jgi:GxxExxY protein
MASYLEKNQPHVSPTAEYWAKRVIDATMTVHRELTAGFIESVYEQATVVEFQNQSIPFENQKEIIVSYQSTTVGAHRLDFLVANCLIVECKAVEKILPIHTAQVISYLKATGCDLGLLINFNVLLLKDGITRVLHPKFFGKT